MGLYANSSMTAEEWKQFWGESDSEEEGNIYVLPKVYPGPKIRCPNCGFWQGNEAVIDTYRWCMRCCTVLQDPSTLYWDTPMGKGPFRVIAASYGHPRDPALAFDVRPKLQARVGVADRLEIGREESLTNWFGNPCPGVLKTLRIRYVSLEGVARGSRREVWLQETEEGHLAEAVSLRVPTALPLVIIFSAEYGSPAGSSRGRGTFNVTDFMQGRVDLAGGQYLFLSRSEPLVELFGDPCPGRDKCLVLHYEILGTEGRAEAQESDSRLLAPINISSTPILAPLIVVESATYGQTREGVDERQLKVQRIISDLLGLQNRKDMEMPLTRDENKRLMQLRPFIAELGYLRNVTPRHVDVTARLQRRVEELGGGVLELVAGKDDLNLLFGNPLPGEKKELRARYLVVGHDSERTTSLEESTSSGYPRNFVLQRKGDVVAQAKDDRMGRSLLEQDVLVDSPKVLPVIEILSSSYGHPRNSTKSYDICTKLRNMIDTQGGESLVIDCEADLFKLFDEPCRGVRKKVKITYVARGLNGRIRVSERDRHLVSDIIVGYYSRENFGKSELLGKRYGLSRPSPPFSSRPAPTTAGAIRMSSQGGTNNNLSALQEDFEAEAKTVEPVLPIIVPAAATDGVYEGKACAGPLAELRRRRRKERREAHQGVIRQQEEDRESERRRVQADKDSRSREVARAVAEAEAAERARLIQAAEDAERAAPLATRLLHIVQKKAEATVAAAVFAGTSMAGRTGAVRAADGATVGWGSGGGVGVLGNARATADDAGRDAGDYYQDNKYFATKGDDFAQLKQHEQGAETLQISTANVGETSFRRGSRDAVIHAGQPSATPFDVTKTPPIVVGAEGRDRGLLGGGDDADERKGKAEENGGDVNAFGIVEGGGGARVAGVRGGTDGGVSQRKAASSLAAEDTPTAADGVHFDSPTKTRDRKQLAPEEGTLRWRDTGGVLSPGINSDGVSTLPVSGIPMHEGGGLKRHKKRGKVKTPAARRPSVLAGVVGVAGVAGVPLPVAGGAMTQEKEEERRRHEVLQPRGDSVPEQRSEMIGDQQTQQSLGEGGIKVKTTQRRKQQQQQQQQQQPNSPDQGGDQDGGLVIAEGGGGREGGGLEHSESQPTTIHGALERDPAAKAPPQATSEIATPALFAGRRKSSEARITEPRAVFVHRASSTAKTEEAPTLDSSALAGGGVSNAGTRRPSKGGVGSA